jgi:hypothetical protein
MTIQKNINRKKQELFVRKNFVLSIVVIVLMVALPIRVMAIDAVASADVKAKIVVPIVLSNTLSLDFGTISTSASAGTVKVTSAGVSSITGGVTLLTSTKTAASFKVTGLPNATYLVTLPAAATTLTDQETSTKTMTVDAWENSTAGILSASGTQDFTVGATLHVGANQAAGTYKGTFNVTVAYN